MKKSGLEVSRSKLEMQDLMHNWIDENQNRIFMAYFDDLIVNSIKRERKSLTSMVFGSIKIDQKEKNAVLIASITIQNKHLKSAICMRSTRFVLLCSRMRRQIVQCFSILLLPSRVVKLWWFFRIYLLHTAKKPNWMTIFGRFYLLLCCLSTLV